MPSIKNQNLASTRSATPLSSMGVAPSPSPDRSSLFTVPSNSVLVRDVRYSLARASILVAEAWRQERYHLEHQIRYLTDCIHAAANIDPSKYCACCSLPLRRQLDARGRTENLLKHQYPMEHVRTLSEQLVRKYEGREAYLIDELIRQFGAEPIEDTYEHRLQSVLRRETNVNNKWRRIMQEARNAVVREDYSSVIRHLSVMRIFLEGSQASTYSCDPAERERRDYLHRMQLHNLGITPSM